MEIPGTASLREARLRLSTEGRRHVIILEEPASGRLFRLSNVVAATFLGARRALTGGAKPTAEQSSEISALAAHLTTLRDSAIAGKKAFNPLFMNVPLFDARPIQSHIGGLAAAVFSYGGLAFMLLAAVFAMWLTAASGFVFFDLTGDIFSLEALLTFAIIAPILKAVHEFGHVLAATRFGAPVRKAGVLLVGLFPLPFVDCTEAEFRTQRFGRIVISLAGLLADVSVGLIAFIAWHFVGDAGTRQVLSNIVVFSTAMTVLFNLNPLMRLDGYFALSDALHRRNLHMESALALTRLRRKLFSAEYSDSIALLRSQPGKIAFAILATFYKIYILLFIAWTLAPKYLGLGAAVVVWGAAVMFLTPIMKAKPVTDPTEKHGKRKLARWILPAAFVAAAFVPMRYQTVVPVTLDLAGEYQVRAAAAGDLASVRAAGPVAAGDVIAELRNIETAVEIALNDADQAMMTYLADSVRGEDPLAAQSAEERIAAAIAIGEELAAEKAALRITAPSTGWFRPLDAMRTGVRLTSGAGLGYLLPVAEETALVGELPEIYARKLRESLVALDLWSADGVKIDAADGLSVRIEQARSVDGGETQIRLAVEAPGAPGELAGRDLYLKMEFEAEPLWRHGVFALRQLQLNFIEAQELAKADAPA